MSQIGYHRTWQKGAVRWVAWVPEALLLVMPACQRQSSSRQPSSGGHLTFPLATQTFLKSSLWHANLAIFLDLALGEVNPLVQKQKCTAWASSKLQQQEVRCVQGEERCDP